MKKISQEEAYLETLIGLPYSKGGQRDCAEPPTVAVASELDEVSLLKYSDERVYDITRVPFTLQPRTKQTSSFLSVLSKMADQSAPETNASDEAPAISEDGEYSDLTRITFSPARKSMLTDMLASSSKKKIAIPALQQSKKVLHQGKYYDITRAPFQRISPQLQGNKGLAIAIWSSSAQEKKNIAETILVKQIIAPAGKLGIVVDTQQSQGPTVVSSIRDDSPLLGQIFLGDEIIAVDNIDVRELAAEDVSKILLTKSTNVRRTLSVLRKIENMEERQVDFGDQLSLSISAKTQALADSKRLEEVEEWLLSFLPLLQQDDVVKYCKCLISDGFDSLDMLEELIVDDLYFMKKAHQRVMARRLSNNQVEQSESNEQTGCVKKVYTVHEALGVAARKGIEATIAEEKRIAAEKAEKGKSKGAKQPTETDNTVSRRAKSLDREESSPTRLQKNQ